MSQINVHVIPPEGQPRANSSDGRRSQISSLTSAAGKPDAHPPLVSRELFAAVQARLA